MYTYPSLNFLNKFSKAKIANWAVALIFVTKIIISGFFSSGYLRELFLPFVSTFTNQKFNPWQYYFAVKHQAIFPYPPLMLYILSPFSFLLNLLNINNLFFTNLIIKVPTFIADFVIFYTLCCLRPQAKRWLIVVYFASPIVFFASYLQGQLDLIPVAFLLGSVYFLLQGRLSYACGAFSAALLCKSTAIVAFPFLIIFIYRKYDIRVCLQFLLGIAFIYILGSLPFLLDAAYIETVLNNPQQSFIYNSAYPIGDLKLYPIILFMIALIAHFFLYKKINNDLLLSYLSLAFSVFLIFAYPIPSWFVWVVPYLSLFLVSPRKERKEFLALYLVFSFIYIAFFIFFYHYPLQSEIPTLFFWNTPLHFSIKNQNVSSIVFTLLAGMLTIQVYLYYRFSIRSNAFYRIRNHATLLGISGDSGAGKTVLLNDICMLLGERRVTNLEGDGEHRWERSNENWQKYTHLDPKANLLHQQVAALENLKQGLPVLRREYDHDTGTFTHEKRVSTNDYIIIAGLHPFYLPKARKLIDIKVYIDTDEKLRRHWKILRDKEKRGYTREQVLAALEKREPDREKYIIPQEKFADVYINYFVNEVFEEGAETSNPAIKLRVRVNANIDLEKLYMSLAECKTLNFEYDYSDDLHTQTILLDGNISKEDIATVAAKTIENIEELTSGNIVWQNDLRGLCQLIVLTVISHHLKEKVE